MTTPGQPRPDGYHAITPTLTLKHTLKAIMFYKRAFGAEVLEVLPAPDGIATMHAAIRIGDSILMLGDEMPGMDGKSAESLGATPVNFYLYVPDVDAVFAKAVGAGATAILPVADMFWGDRCGTVKDPFGYAWTLATHTRELSREEIERGAKKFFAQPAPAAAP